MTSEAQSIARTEARISKAVSWMFFAYSIGSGFNTVVSTQFISYFMTDVAMISPVAMASVLTVTRFADLAVSLVSGAIVQKTNTRLGAYRPWVLFCPLVTWVGCILCFMNPDISTFAKLVLTSIGYCMTHFPMNFLSVAQSGLQTKVAGTNPENRLDLASKRVQGGAFSRIISGTATVPLIAFFTDLQLISNAYFIVVLIYGLFGFSGSLLIYLVTRKYDTYDPAMKVVEGSATNVRLTRIYIDSLKNPSVLLLLVVDVLRRVAANAVSVGAPYYYRYSAGDMSYMSLSGFVAGIVGFIAAVIAVPIARKIGKKNSSVFSGVVPALLYIAAALFTDNNPILYIAIASGVTIGLAVVNTWGVNLYLDAAELQLYKTGEDNRPFIMSLANVPTKFGFIFSGPLLALLLGLSGYEANSMSDTSGFVFWLGIIPAVLYLLSSLLIWFGYRINDAEAAEAAAENARMFAQKAASALGRREEEE